MGVRTGRRLAAVLVAVLVGLAAALVIGAATGGVAMAAHGGDGQRGLDGVGVGGASGESDNTNGLFGASADGIDPRKLIVGH